MSDPATHPEQPDDWDRAVDLALELGRARVRLARYEAQEARIRALCRARVAMHDHDGFPTTYTSWVLAALDEPEAADD